MHIIDELNPEYVFSAKAQETIVKCNGCGVQYQLKDGIVCCVNYISPEKHPERSYIPFCDAVCLTEHWIEGVA